MADLQKELKSLRMEVLKHERELVLGKFPCANCEFEARCKEATKSLERIYPNFICICGPFDEWKGRKDFFNGQLTMLDRILSSYRNPDKESLPTD